MIPPFLQSNYNCRMYLMILTSVIIMQLGAANERRGQGTNGSSECDHTIIQVNFTCLTEGTPIPNTRSTKREYIFEKEAENRTLTKHFKNNVQNNTNSIFASSTLNKTCKIIDDGQTGYIVEKCSDLSGNLSNSSVKEFSFENALYETLVSMGPIFVESL